MNHSENKGNPASEKPTSSTMPHFTPAQMQSVVDWIMKPQRKDSLTTPKTAAESHLSLSSSSSLSTLDTHVTSLTELCSHAARVHNQPASKIGTNDVSSNAASSSDRSHGNPDLPSGPSLRFKHPLKSPEAKNLFDTEKISAKATLYAGSGGDGSPPQSPTATVKAITLAGKSNKVDPKPNPYLVKQDMETSPRRLLTVRKVQKVRRLRIKNMAAAIVDGRTVLVLKASQFKPGDFVLFLELGTFVPSGDARFNILSQLNNGLGLHHGERGYLLLPRFAAPYEKLQDLSEGFIFKMNKFPEIKDELDKLRKASKLSNSKLESLLQQFREVDYSSHFGITELKLTKDPANSLGKLPFFIRSTDSKRLRECPNLFVKDKYEKHIYQESVKMDGQSMTCYFVAKDSPFFKFLNPLPAQYDGRAVHPNGRFGVCSKNVEVNNCAPNTYWTTAIAEGLPDKLARLGQSVAIMGEQVGHNITGNRHGYGKDQYEFFVFSIFDIDEQAPWPPQQVEEFAAEQGLRHVEVRGYITLRDIASCHQDIQNRADLTSGEGLVYKNTFDGRWFKVLSQPYIARDGKEPAQDVTSESHTMAPEKLEELACFWKNAHTSDTGTMKRIWEEDTWEKQIRQYCSMWAEAILANARETGLTALSDKSDE